jgi:hypothetical protein
MKATIESFEAVNLRTDIVGDRGGTSAPHDLDIAREKSQHALLAEAPMEHPHRLGVRGGFLGPLGGSAVGKQHERANHLIAPLGLINQRQLGKCCGGVHSNPSSLLSGRGVM